MPPEPINIYDWLKEIQMLNPDRKFELTDEYKRILGVETIEELFEKDNQ